MGQRNSVGTESWLNQAVASRQLSCGSAQPDCRRTAAIGVHAHGDDNGSGADLHGSAQPAVEVGGIEVEVGVTLALKRPVQEGLHLQVDLSADTAHLGFRDPALAAESSHQGINLAGGDAGDIGLHHDGVGGLVHPPAGFENRGQEAAGAEFGDPQVDVAHLGPPVSGKLSPL